MYPAQATPTDRTTPTKQFNAQTDAWTQTEPETHVKQSSAQFPAIPSTGTTDNNPHLSSSENVTDRTSIYQLKDWDVSADELHPTVSHQLLAPPADTGFPIKAPNPGYTPPIFPVYEKLTRDALAAVESNVKLTGKAIEAMTSEDPPSELGQQTTQMLIEWISTGNLTPSPPADNVDAQAAEMARRMQEAMRSKWGDNQLRTPDDRLLAICAYFPSEDCGDMFRRHLKNLALPVARDIFSVFSTTLLRGYVRNKAAGYFHNLDLTNAAKALATKTGVGYALLIEPLLRTTAGLVWSNYKGTATEESNRARLTQLGWGASMLALAAWTGQPGKMAATMLGTKVYTLSRDAVQDVVSFSSNVRTLDQAALRLNAGIYGVQQTLVGYLQGKLAPMSGTGAWSSENTSDHKVHWNQEAINSVLNMVGEVFDDYANIYLPHVFEERDLKAKNGGEHAFRHRSDGARRPPGAEVDWKIRWPGFGPLIANLIGTGGANAPRNALFINTNALVTMASVYAAHEKFSEEKTNAFLSFVAGSALMFQYRSFPNSIGTGPDVRRNGQGLRETVGSQFANLANALQEPEQELTQRHPGGGRRGIRREQTVVLTPARSSWVKKIFEEERLNMLAEDPAARAKKANVEAMRLFSLIGAGMSIDSEDLQQLKDLAMADILDKTRGWAALVDSSIQPPDPLTLFEQGRVRLDDAPAYQALVKVMAVLARYNDGRIPWISHYHNGDNDPHYQTLQQSLHRDVRARLEEQARAVGPENVRVVNERTTRPPVRSPRHDSNTRMNTN
ncbi:MAG: hypothetical protein KA795_05825 [Burkholderiaceae bacterium]|nr:hypothetical protein [Burkholderiaceae bacterium]